MENYRSDENKTLEEECLKLKGKGKFSMLNAMDDPIPHDMSSDILKAVCDIEGIDFSLINTKDKSSPEFYHSLIKVAKESANTNVLTEVKRSQTAQQLQMKEMMLQQDKVINELNRAVEELKGSIKHYQVEKKVIEANPISGSVYPAMLKIMSLTMMCDDKRSAVMQGKAFAVKPFLNVIDNIECQQKLVELIMNTNPEKLVSEIDSLAVKVKDLALE